MLPSPKARATPKNRSRRAGLIFASILGYFAAAGVLSDDAKTAGGAPFLLKELRLPGASGLVSLDYFAYEPHTRRLWVPASNTGRVAVIDTRTDGLMSIEGLRTANVDFAGKHPVLGPSSVALGHDVVYVGNRADSTIALSTQSPSKSANAFPSAHPVDSLKHQTR